MKKILSAALVWLYCITAAFAVSTTAVTLNSTSWVDLGAGPIQLGSTGSAVYAISDTSPSISVGTGYAIPINGYVNVQTTSHVWASLTNQSNIGKAIVSPITSWGGGTTNFTWPGTATLTDYGTAPTGTVPSVNSFCTNCSSTSLTWPGTASATNYGTPPSSSLTVPAVNASVSNFPASQPVTGTFWQATQPVSGTFWQTTQPVSIASMPSTPVTGTFWQTTQPVSIASLPVLPTGSNVIGSIDILSHNGVSLDSVAGTPNSQVVTIQGNSGGVAVPVTGTLSASIGAFAPTPAYASLAVGAVSSRVALPNGTNIKVYNSGSNPAYVLLGNSSVVATTANDIIFPNSWDEFAVGANTNIAAIETAGSTTLTISGGAGIAAGAVGPPATQPVSIASMPSTPVTGTFWQTTQPVSIASMPSTPVTGTFWQATQPVSGTITVSNFPVTQPVSGTFWQATQPVSIASMPSTPVTGTFWQTTQPVSIASMPSTPVTGTFWQTTQPVSIASLPALATGANTIGAISNTSFGLSGTLPAFAATPTFNLGTIGTASTAANQTTQNGYLSTIATNSGAQATSANQTTQNGYLSTIATNSGTQSTSGNQTTMIANLGTLHTDLVTLNATAGNPIAAGTNAIGSITNTGFNALQGGVANAVGNPFYIAPGTGATFTAVQATAANLNMTCANCSGSSLSTTDNATFTPTTSLFIGIGGAYLSTLPTALTTGHQATAQITQYRSLWTDWYDATGAEKGVAANPVQVSLANTGANGTAISVNVANTNANGSALSAASSPVVIASDQAAVAIKLNTTPSVANGNGVVPTVGGAAMDATHGLYTNLLQGNAVNSVSNPIFARITDATTGITVKAGSTASVAGDTSMVVELNPTMTPAFNISQIGGTSAATMVVAASTAPVTATNAALTVDLRPDSPGIMTLGPAAVSGSIPVTLSSQYPTNATTATPVPETISATATTASGTATLAAASGKTTFICGWNVDADATAAAVVALTITGTVTGTMNYRESVAALTAGTAHNYQRYNPCIPASAANTAIVVNFGAAGSGGNSAASAWGYQL